MLILDLTNGYSSDPDIDQQEEYPDQVLESEWNPMLAEIKSTLPKDLEPSKPAPEVIDATLARLNQT